MFERVGRVSLQIPLSYRKPPIRVLRGDRKTYQKSDTICLPATFAYDRRYSFSTCNILSSTTGVAPQTRVRSTFCRLLTDQDNIKSFWRSEYIYRQLLSYQNIFSDFTKLQQCKYCIYCAYFCSINILILNRFLTFMQS